MPRSQRLTLGLLGLCLLAACGGEDSIYIPWPESADARTWILWSSVAPVLEATSERGPLLRSVQARESFVFLGYTEDLSSLGLEGGELTGAPTCRSCALISPDAIFATRSDLAEREGWQSLTEVPSEVLDALVPDRDPRCDTCIEMKGERLGISDAVLPARTTALPFDHDHVILSASENGASSFWLLGSDGGYEMLCEGPADFVPTAAYRANGKVAWYGDSLGRV